MTSDPPEVCRRYLPAVRALALSGTLDIVGAKEVAERALARFHQRSSGDLGAAGLLALAEESTREEAKSWVREQGGRTTEIVGIPSEAAARARVPALNLPEIFGDLPPERSALMLLEAVSWVPAQYELLFLLRYVEGLDYGAIAELAGISAEDVGTGLAAARRLYERELGFHLKRLASQ